MDYGIRGVVTMLHELADDCKRFYSQSEWVCIIGV
jgi:hypothetical protein